jgi:hypothetical protein
MPNLTRTALALPLLWLGLAGNLLAQQADDDPQRKTLTALRAMAVHARVQLSEGATLPTIDENPLRTKLEQSLRREGISLVARDDVRDGSGAHLSLLYLVLETRDKAREKSGFAAFSCLQLEQHVIVPRLGRYAYAVVPTWRSCGVLMGPLSPTAVRSSGTRTSRSPGLWRPGE